MGHLFQVECGEKNPSGNNLLFIMAKETGKGISKDFGKEKWKLLACIYENKGK